MPSNLKSRCCTIALRITSYFITHLGNSLFPAFYSHYKKCHSCYENEADEDSTRVSNHSNANAIASVHKEVKLSMPAFAFVQLRNTQSH